MISQRYQNAIQWLGGLIDSRMEASGPPPETLARFYHWALSGAWRVIFLAALISALAGATEVLAMYLLGQVVDVAASVEPISDSVGLLVGAILLLMILRPALFGLSASFQSVVVGPNLFALVVGRLHRWTLGQAVTFFDNDFAGRIAQKQMQVARSITETVIETVNAVLFALATVIGTAILIVAIDARLLFVLGFWFCSYVVFLRIFLPRIRARSKARAGAQAMLTGQVLLDTGGSQAACFGNLARCRFLTFVQTGKQRCFARTICSDKTKAVALVQSQVKIREKWFGQHNADVLQVQKGHSGSRNRKCAASRGKGADLF